jgi:hypothetical protein
MMKLSDLQNSNQITATLLLFMSMGRDCVSELQPPTVIMFIHKMIYEHGEPRWNDFDKKKTEKL